MLADMDFGETPVIRRLRILRRRLGDAVVGGVLVLAVLHAGVFAGRLQTSAALVRTDEADVGVGFAVAPIVVDDDDLRGTADERVGVELLLLSGGEITSEPLFQKGTQRGLFAQRGVEAARPDKVGFAVIAELGGFKDKAELLLRAVVSLHGFGRRDVNADGVAVVFRVSVEGLVGLSGEFHGM